jgi:MFS transporter, PPP family, 3-phenylpropionic acid transporter
MPTERATIALRLCFFYAAYFAFIGIYLPFWPVWLGSRGLGPEDIAIVLAVSIAAKAIGNPLCAHIADRTGERRRPIIVLAVLAFASFALFPAVREFWPLVLVSLLFFTVWPPIMALGESLTMINVRSVGLDYGRTRLWGSISFIVLAVLGGHALDGRHPDILFWMLLASLAMFVIAAILLPDARPPPRAIALGRMPVLDVLRRPSFVLFLAAATAIQGSHAVYYAFGTIHWRQAGYSDAVIGALWAEGVIAEILLFALGDRIVRRLDPSWLLVVGGLAGGVRWAVLGMTDALAFVVAVQALHAFSFGAAHLAAIHFISRAVPPHLSATAQSLYAGVVMGLGLGLLLFVSGGLYEAHGSGAYHAMAACALAGAALAMLIARPPA